MFDLPESQSRVSASRGLIATLRNSHLEVGFDLNGLCYGFTPFCLEEEFYLGYSRLAYQVGPLSANQRYLRVGKLAQLYVKEIVRLHGIPLDIVSDRDQIFQAYF